MADMRYLIIPLIGLLLALVSFIVAPIGMLFAVLNRAGGVMDTLCLKVGLVGKFWGSEVPKISLLSKNPYLGFPLKANRGYPQQFCFAQTISFSDILSVPGSGNITEICNTVIRRIAIYMVDFHKGHTSSYIKPSESMRPKKFSNSYVDRTVLVSVSSTTTSECYRASPESPSKNSRFRIVVQKFLKPFLRKGRISISHAVVPFKQWFGQRLGSVSALVGLRHFNPFVIESPICGT